MKNEFEKHEKLTMFISEMASTGKIPKEWSIFIATLNEALNQHENIKNQVCFCDCSNESERWNCEKTCNNKPNIIQSFGIDLSVVK